MRCQKHHLCLLCQGSVRWHPRAPCAPRLQQGSSSKGARGKTCQFFFGRGLVKKHPKPRRDRGASAYLHSPWRAAQAPTLSCKCGAGGWRGQCCSCRTMRAVRGWNLPAIINSAARRNRRLPCTKAVPRGRVGSGGAPRPPSPLRRVPSEQRRAEPAARAALPRRKSRAGAIGAGPGFVSLLCWNSWGTGAAAQQLPGEPP